MERRQMKNSHCFKPPCWGKSSTFWKWHCLRKISLESKRLIQTWWIWCQILLGKEYSIQYSKNQWHSIKNVVEITDQSRCILFGPPCIVPRGGSLSHKLATYPRPSTSNMNPKWRIAPCYISTLNGVRPAKLKGTTVQPKRNARAI